MQPVKETFFETLLNSALVGGILHRGFQLSRGKSTFIGFQVALLCKVQQIAIERLINYSSTHLKLSEKSRSFVKIGISAVTYAAIFSVVTYSHGLGCFPNLAVVSSVLCHVVKYAIEKYKDGAIELSASLVDHSDHYLMNFIYSEDPNLKHWKDSKGLPLNPTIDDFYMRVKFTGKNKHEFLEAFSVIIPSTLFNQTNGSVACFYKDQKIRIVLDNDFAKEFERHRKKNEASKIPPMYVGKQLIFTDERNPEVLFKDSTLISETEKVFLGFGFANTLYEEGRAEFSFEVPNLDQKKVTILAAASRIHFYLPLLNTKKVYVRSFSYRYKQSDSISCQYLKGNLLLKINV